MTRWWEYYAVRYLVGTVVGALVVALSVNETASPYRQVLIGLVNLKGQEFLGVSTLAAAGFAYCYIASAPVLTFHAMRAHIRLDVLKRFWVHETIALLVLVGAVIFLISVKVLTSDYWIVAVVVGSQSLLILFAIATNFSVVEDFYRELSQRRSETAVNEDEKPTASSEYITSYRHLREHGNAVLILLMEGALGFALYTAGKHRAEAAIPIVATWLAPAALVWLVGCILESRLVSRAI